MYTINTILFLINKGVDQRVSTDEILPKSHRKPNLNPLKEEEKMESLADGFNPFNSISKNNN